MRGKWIPALILTVTVILVGFWLDPKHAWKKGSQIQAAQIGQTEALWIAPDSNSIPDSEEGALIRYGRLLIIRTSDYFGPAGKIGRTANGMNCQNCHLYAGTKPWGNNFAAVYSTYPKYRPRRGGIETIPERVNDCFCRSLNGEPIDSNGREMQAMIAYFKWLGQQVKKGEKPRGSGLEIPALLHRASDTIRGRKIYVAKCQLCHGPSGQGQFSPGTVSYLYPPLWGLHSYNSASGLYRISSLAAYVRNNMPFGSTYLSRQLTDEEAWDVAAFVNSQPRPIKNFPGDWPDIHQKPFDFPFGPYADSLPESQHKYGPFDRIVKSN